MERDNSFDAWRGVAILFVIAIHAGNAGLVFLNGPFEWNYYASLGLRQIYAFAVPLFFFMAGFFAEEEPKLIASHWKSFVKKKLSRILVPYLFWSLAIILLLQQNFDFASLIKKLVLGQAQAPYYFLIVLSILYALTPSIIQLGFKKSTTSIILLLNLTTVSTIYCLRVLIGNDFTWEMAALPFTSWIVFYYLGLRTRAYNIEPIVPYFTTLSRAITLVLVCLLTSGAEAFFLTINPAGPYLWAGSSIKFSSLLYSIAVINLFITLKKENIRYPRTLIYLGQISFGVYLIHELFRDRISGKLSQIESLFYIQPLFQIVVVVITISICIMVIETTRKIFGRTNASKYFGF